MFETWDVELVPLNLMFCFQIPFLGLYVSAAAFTVLCCSCTVVLYFSLQGNFTIRECRILNSKQISLKLPKPREMQQIEVKEQNKNKK